MTDLDDVIQLVRDQPLEIPDAAHREEVRTALLAHQQQVGAPRGRRIYMLGLPLAVAAAGALWFVQPAAPRTPVVLSMPSLPSLARGHVHPHAGAAFDLASMVPDEIVKLHDGTIDLDVDPLQPHERFRVVVGASEIEVRGTAFSVTADHDHLLEVHVTHGRVEVRPIGDTAVTLVGGGAWSVPQITAVPVQILPAAPHRKPAPKPSADQLAYTDGWSALRQSRFDDAVVAFTRTIATDPDGVLADDARFWQAVALGRASRSGDAIVAFRALVDEHPGSSHSAEASVMLGWLLVDAKQLREARERFTAGVDDATASVRESARAGIAAIDRAAHP